MTENIIQLHSKKELTFRKKVQAKVFHFVERVGAVKRKADAYFDIEGCISSQVWYYGSITAGLVAGAIGVQALITTFLLK